MKISYAITVSTEITEFSELMKYIVGHMSSEDEIVVLVDESKGFSEDIEVFEGNNIHYFYDVFQNNFADWKNNLNSHCMGDWIFQIDADEMPSEPLIQHLHEILDINSKAECIALPRKNIVNGITPEDILRWRWRNSEHGINWPDYQCRLYRNNFKIRWKGLVHEKLVGFDTYTCVPPDNTPYYLNHFKTIEKQKKQNSYYETLK